MKYLPEKQRFFGKGGKIIKQVYLDLKNPEIAKAIEQELPEANLAHIAEARIRFSQQQDTTVYTLTVKSSGGEVRDEFETEISQEQFEELLQFGSEGETNKERFECPISENLIAEVDVYSGRLEGLVTAEIEYDRDEISQSEVEMLFANLLGRGEVISEYQCFKNKNLAKTESLEEVQDNYLRERIAKSCENTEVGFKPQIKKIALTGGPCAGKSQVLEALKAGYGHKLHVLPEVATQLLEMPYDQGGVGIPGKDIEWSREWQDNFQRRIIEKQLVDETLLTQIASLSQEEAVLICDRGILDGAAYVEDGRESFLAQNNLELEQCLELYDAVIHLNSLATDNPQLYEELKHSNPSRFEDGDTARKIDEAIAHAYEGHKALIRIPAQPSIEDKISYCRQIVENIGGISREDNAELAIVNDETSAETGVETRLHNESLNPVAEIN